MSLKKEILHIFKAKRYHSPEWTNGAKVERWAMEERGKKASNASRRLRELVQEGFLERRMQGKSVWYRYKVETNQKALV